MKWLAQLVGLTVVLIAGTWFAGWWFVPVAAGAWGAWAAGQRTAVLTAMLAGALAWGGLLAYDASAGPMDRLLQIFHPLLRMRGGTVIVLTIAYAALLSASAAGLTRGIRRLLTPA